MAMRRREFITLLGGATVTWPLAARAQQSERVRRIGVLVPFTANDPEAQARNMVLEQSLRELGWTIGRNLQIEHRSPGGEAASIRRDAAELVALARRTPFWSLAPRPLVWCCKRLRTSQSCS
jgi:putative ABC transport system substrate-binding protein